jgi:hypothetical protein
LFSERTDAARYGKWDKMARELEKLTDLKNKNLLTDAEITVLKTEVFDRYK